MPPLVPPPTFAAPYDEVELILYFARVIANDAGVTIQGNLLSDSQPYIMPLLNLAWRKLQARLNNNNIEEFPQEVIITGLPAQAASAFSDPAIQAYINYSEYNDGASINPSFQIPSDCLIPVRLWERPTGQNAQFQPMTQSRDGLPSTAKTSYLLLWEWRNDAIFFKGANQALDLRVRYKRILQDVSSTADMIPLIRCAVALAYLVVEIHAAGRGSVILPTFQAEKEDAIKQIINLTTRKHQRVNFRRQAYSRRNYRWGSY